MCRTLLSTAALSLAFGCAASDASGDSGTDIPVVAGWFTIGHFITGAGLENIELCVVSTEACQTTDANGNATLDLPADAEIALTVAGGEYAPQIYPLRTTSEQLVLSYYLAPLDLLLAGAADAGVEVDESMGQMAISLQNVSLESTSGYAATLSAGDGPYYVDDLSITIDLSADETSRSGRLLALNIPTDTVTVTLDGPGTCRPKAHYWQAGPNKAVMAILPGFLAGVTMICE